MISDPIEPSFQAHTLAGSGGLQTALVWLLPPCFGLSQGKGAWDTMPPGASTSHLTGLISFELDGALSSRHLVCLTVHATCGVPGPGSAERVLPQGRAESTPCLLTPSSPCPHTEVLLLGSRPCMLVMVGRVPVHCPLRLSKLPPFRPFLALNSEGGAHAPP